MCLETEDDGGLPGESGGFGEWPGGGTGGGAEGGACGDCGGEPDSEGAVSVWGRAWAAVAGIGLFGVGVVCVEGKRVAGVAADERGVSEVRDGWGGAVYYGVWAGWACVHDGVRVAVGHIEQRERACGAEVEHEAEECARVYGAASAWVLTRGQGWVESAGPWEGRG